MFTKTEEKKIYTVSQLTYQIKNLLEGERDFQNVTLKGEISNFVRHRTGHLYFALKDEKSQIRAIMFAGNTRSLNFVPKDGDKVTVTGSIDLYAPSGTYSIQVRSMQMDGAGELYLKYLELKKNLEQLGWFDKEKKQLPKFPKTIGVVTSPTGAVIEDITNTVNRRYRLTNILLYPALVQGKDASKSIATQIKQANLDNIADVLIVGRGGGSIEDLWAFNEIDTIEAIYSSKIPIITAIGHETDTTISDFVSDHRASTPTAAAEMATPDKEELINQLKELRSNLKYRIDNKFKIEQTNLVNLVRRLETNGPEAKLKDYNIKLNEETRQLKRNFKVIVESQIVKFNNLIIRMKNSSPENKLNENKKRITELKERIEKNYNQQVQNKKVEVTILEQKIKSPEHLITRYKERIEILNKTVQSSSETILKNKIRNFEIEKSRLENANPLKIMDRGFALLKSDDNIITSIKDINEKDKLDIELKDGYIRAEVINKKER